MTPAELQARAHARAHDEHLYIRSVPNRPGYYTARSRTEPSRRYSLVAIGQDIACSCNGFYHRRHCKHVEALRNRLAREGGVQSATSPTDPAVQPSLFRVA
jgi:hypothetical protein